METKDLREIDFIGHHRSGMYSTLNMRKMFQHQTLGQCGFAGLDRLHDVRVLILRAGAEP